MLAGFLAALVLLLGCNSETPETAESGKFEVVATTTMLTDMVRKIAGEDVTVIGLIEPGIDPHSYAPSPRVISNLQNADLIFYNGMHLEGKLTETFTKLEDKAVAITDSLPKDQLISSEEIGEEYGDPHVWGNPELWALAIPGIVEQLSKLVPAKSADFKSRGDAYQKKILDLHQWAKGRMNEIPEENRILITSHDAFNYFGRAFEIQVYAPQGISTVDEPSGAEILAAIDLIKEKGVKTVFPESSVSQAIIDRISKDAGVKKGTKLYSDSCGKEGDTSTYIGMMKHNVNTIVDGLK